MVTEKGNFTPFLLTPMSVKDVGAFSDPHNRSGVSRREGIPQKQNMPPDLMVSV